MYYTFNTHCLTEAQTRVSEEPGYDYCKSVELHLYFEHQHHQFRQMLSHFLK